MQTMSVFLSFYDQVSTTETFPDFHEIWYRKFLQNFSMKREFRENHLSDSLT
jgi:hypothetical protein